MSQSGWGAHSLPCPSSGERIVARRQGSMWALVSERRDGGTVLLVAVLRDGTVLAGPPVAPGPA